MLPAQQWSLLAKCDSNRWLRTSQRRWSKGDDPFPQPTTCWYLRYVSSSSATNHFVCIIVTARRRLAIARIDARSRFGHFSRDSSTAGSSHSRKAGFEIIFQDELTINLVEERGTRGELCWPFREASTAAVEDGSGPHTVSSGGVECERLPWSIAMLMEVIVSFDAHLNWSGA